MKPNNFCRLCAKNVENTLENDLFAKYNKFLLQQIKELTGIKLKAITRQNLPRYFCSKCKNDVSNACEIRNRILKAQSYFKSEDYKQKFVNFNENDLANEATLFDTVFLPVKQECDEVETNPILSEDENKDADQKKDENYTKPIIKSDINLDNDDTETDTCFEIVSDSSSEDSVFNEIELIRDEKNFSTIKPKRKRTIKHKGKKLKPSGEKLYKCHHCDLEFKRPNTRTKHERLMHSRDWPFQCAECGKRFTTHDAGRNHMVVHTKIRNFHCAICKSSFLLKKHLTTHYRSETHKNNERKINEEHN